MKKVYIADMKKFAMVVLLIALAFSAVFANGTPEEQQAFIENLVKNTTTTYSTTRPASGTATASSAGSEIISRDMATLERLYQYVEKNFLFDIDYDAVYEAMATALFDALDDKYSYFVAEEESEEYEENVSGVYGGIGIYFSKTYVKYQDPDDESTIYCKITQVFPNTPCSKLGVRAGDMIIGIDGTDVNELEATDCAKLMKGLPGTTVDVTFKRNDNIFTLTIPREIITVPTVEFQMMDDNVAYLRVLEFSPNTYTAINKALGELLELGMKDLVIDLRDNPGGDVDATLAILDLFISGKSLLEVNYKDPSKNSVYVAHDGILVPSSVDIAILVNGGTASSAEIMSVSMKDNERATLFGSTTFGKGIMQQISSFGKAYTSVTIASFTGPKGTEIHKVGVSPDYQVEEITILDEEVAAYTELLNSKEVSDFVDKNPEYNDFNIYDFAVSHADTGLREIVLRVIVRNEYLSRLNYDDRPLYDLEFDNVLKAAYDYLKSNGAIVPEIVAQ